ncbi:hypothetical protein VCRA2111O320_270019 [Vibrio crassostreae]|nr:hypothetical protein VCRA2111O320_270019 [Vibrio crassostreae]
MKVISNNLLYLTTRQKNTLDKNSWYYKILVP